MKDTRGNFYFSILSHNLGRSSGTTDEFATIPFHIVLFSAALVELTKSIPAREFEARLRHAATEKLSLSTQQKMGTFFELGNDKAAKGEGWAPPFISCAQDTVGL